MSEANEELHNNQFNQLAFNKLYKICYKNITELRGAKQFVQSDEANVTKCHQKLVEAFKIILPSVLPVGDNAE